MANDEFCPECGEFVDSLNEMTGFCFVCTPSSHPLIISRTERWLLKHAEDIEYEMQRQSITAKVAIAYVRRTSKAVCIICRKPIKHGTQGRHFICNSTPECRKIRRRYRYLIYDKGYTKSQALDEITGETPHGD